MLNSSLTLFCRELDKVMEAYDQDVQINLDLADQLAAIQYLLDEHVDCGMTHYEAFDEMQKRLKHDLESFLYHQIYDELEIGETTYAGELLEGFYRYVGSKKWYDYLRARKEVEEDPETGFELLEKLVVEQKEEPDVDFFLELLSFLAEKGSHTHFRQVAELILQHLRVERDFQDFLRIVSAHYHYLSLHSLAIAGEKILSQRQDRALTQLIDYQDIAIQDVKSILQQKLTI